MPEIGILLHRRIRHHGEHGDELLGRGALGDAVTEYRTALQLIPEPRHDWAASTWVLGSLGDVLFRLGRYDEAHDALSEAVACPGGVGNPFLHLRLGQALYELGRPGPAADELASAWRGAGPGIFDDEAPRYLELVQRVLRPAQRG
jgi:tetratricopeptide (TPR) repeat protein